MSTLATVDQKTPLAAEDEFLAIVCSDHDLLRAEFDEIVAAEWPSSPPDRPVRDNAAERSPGPEGSWPRAKPARRLNRPWHPGVGGWSRQRSPPPSPRRHGANILAGRMDSHPHHRGPGRCSGRDHNHATKPTA